jgi:hypothetical protein
MELSVYGKLDNVGRTCFITPSEHEELSPVQSHDSHSHTTPHIQYVPLFVVGGNQLSAVEVNRISRSNELVNITWMYTPTSHYASTALCLMKHRDTVGFTCLIS